MPSPQQKQWKDPLELVLYTSSLHSRAMRAAMERVLKLSPSLEKKVKIRSEVSCTEIELIEIH
jgi:hypothetical protein